MALNPKPTWEREARERAIGIAIEALGLETWWRNYYECHHCNEDWCSDWSAQCDDECAGCGRSFTPYQSIEIECRGGAELPDE